MSISVPAARSPRLFTPSFAFAMLSVHALFISYNMSLVQVPRSLAGEPAWVVGLVVGAMGISGMLTRPLTGVWVDAGSRQRWVRLGAFGNAIAFGGYALGLGPWPMLAFRLLHGVAMGFFTTALLAIVGNALPSARRGLGIGLYQSANAAAQLYAAAAAVWIIGAASMRVAFLVSAAAALVALAMGMLAGDPQRPAPPPALPWRARAWISRPALLPALVFLCVTTPWGAVIAFLPLFTDERGLGNPGLFYTVVAVSQVASRFSVGWLADRLNATAVVMPALVLGCAGLLVLASAHSQTMLLIAAALYGLGLAATQTSIVALVVGRTPATGMGASMATYTMAWDVGAVAGGIGLGLLVEATSNATVFALASVLPVAGAVLFYTRVRERRTVPVEGESGTVYSAESAP
ncbi:MAG: MFS transporter [Dehalococcoidia bacterium]|nr:MFS transporter [Dehalococcoidia bacterium]